MVAPGAEVVVEPAGLEVVVVDPDGRVVDVVVVVVGRVLDVVVVVVEFVGPPGRVVVVVVGGRVVDVVVDEGTKMPGMPPPVAAGVVEDAEPFGG